MTPAKRNSAQHTRTLQRSRVNIILVGDVDMLADQNWAQVRDVAGERVPVPTANNADFFINAIDNLRGNQGLVSLRGRGLGHPALYGDCGYASGSGCQVPGQGTGIARSHR